MGRVYLIVSLRIDMWVFLLILVCVWFYKSFLYVLYIYFGYFIVKLNCINKKINVYGVNIFLKWYVDFVNLLKYWSYCLVNYWFFG